MDFVKANLNDKNYTLYDSLEHSSWSYILNSYYLEIEIIGNIYNK